ncbi:MAG: helix-turn-helix domain-containing protein [Clostridiales Family XIII bacterium]|jgi:transcriptional regulator with XRE-family HTH domain|nr:helix-turn-helix domain-containing protein [Clostridiales Family XIII bacterium]
MDILNRINELLDERGWSKYRLAKEADVSEGSLNNMFRQNSLPTIPTLEALCKGFGITLAQFFSENGEPIVLTNEQEEMLALWNTLTKNQKQATIELFKTM